MSKTREDFQKNNLMLGKISHIIKKENIFEIFRFGSVGIIITFSYCIFLLILIDFLKIQFYLSNIIVVTITSFMSFYGHKLITFRKKNKANYIEVSKFLIQVLLTFFLSNLILTIGYNLEITSWVVILITGITIPICNFLLMRLWVFKF